jgi:hypothetical protein
MVDLNIESQGLHIMGYLLGHDGPLAHQHILHLNLRVGHSVLGLACYLPVAVW